MPRVRKAIITAAGRGTRQYPASTVVPKELFPLVDRDGVTRPVVQIIAQEALESGIEEICLVTQPGQEPLFRDYFRAAAAAPPRAAAEAQRLADIGRRLRFAVQESPEGFGHAVYQARDFAAGEPVLLLLGDHVYISDRPQRCARQLIEVFEANRLEALTAVHPTPEDQLSLFGIIRGRPVETVPGGFEAQLIIEKPSPEIARAQLTTPGLPAGHYLGHFGMHVFGPGIFDALGHLIRHELRQNNEFQLTAAQEHLRSQGARYWCLLVAGQRCDMGVPQGLVETQLALALAGVFRDDVLATLARQLTRSSPHSSTKAQA
jgi:UTP--glucose-1-phosphate uridylyltransferase